jgi:hypothetical protein
MVYRWAKSLLTPSRSLLIEVMVLALSVLQMLRRICSKERVDVSSLGVEESAHEVKSRNLLGLGRYFGWAEGLWAFAELGKIWAFSEGQCPLGWA